MRKILLSAEPYAEGVFNYETGRPYKLSDLKISDSLICKIKLWYSEYEKYTSKTIAELKPYSHEIEKLDKQGFNLLREMKQLLDLEGESKLYYLSFCKDGYGLVINENNLETILK